MTDPDELAALASAVAQEAAALLMDRPARVTVAATKSSGTDVVTAMDRASEELITTRLLAHRPQDAILGEEGADRPGSSGIRWVIDPLDGTVNYLYGLPGWAVSVAAQDETGTLVGVVAVPTHGETFTAVRGRGAFVHDARGTVGLRVDPAPYPLAQALVATGFGYRADRRRRQAAVAAALLPEVRDLRRMGAAATDLCHVAAGRVDGFFELGPQPWDHAAGGLVATEAGAVLDLVPLDGETDPLVLAARPGVYDALAAAVVPRYQALPRPTAAPR